MFIPIGSKCLVRQSIEKYLGIYTMQTNLFDWSITNFETIVHILENIDVEFKPEDFIDINQICGDHRSFNHTNLRLDSIHDFDANKDYNVAMTEFIDKYNRRLKRLKDSIMYSNEKIHFVHLFDVYPNFRIPNQDIYVPNVEQVYRFIMAIKKINENCIFSLNFLVPPIDCIFYKNNYNSNFYVDEDKINELRITSNIFVYRVLQNVNVDPQNHRCAHWLLDYIYDDIIKH